MRTTHQPRRFGRLWALVLSATLAAPPAAWPQAPPPGGETGSPPATAAGSALLGASRAELDRLAAFDGTLRARRELLLRNLSRYFGRYLVPSNREELGRLLGTLQRMAARFAAEGWEAASALAQQEDAATIELVHLARIVDRAPPPPPPPHPPGGVFPGAPDGGEIEVETIDLTAFEDTGFAWEVLAGLAQLPPREGATLLPLAPDAIRYLARGVAAYGLLLLRVGGLEAQREFAPELVSRHLRDAGKAVARQAIDWAGLATPAPIPAPPGRLFTDVTDASGIRFRHVTSDWLSEFRRYGRIAPTFSGGGVSAADLDGDDWPDLVFCGGAGCSLFRNRRDGTFENATAASGLNVPGEARMPVLADFDNDGWRDLFITYARDTNRIFRNLGDGRFADVTAGSGLERDGDISGPATACDVDNDGLLDLYVGNFGDYLAGENPWSPTDSTNAQPNRLYRNLGGFKFADVSAAAGIGDTGWAQALSHLDHDNDGDQDLYVANDFGRNELFVNNGDGTFRAAGEATGSNDRFHGMNVAYSDLNRDGHADIFVTNIWFWNPVQKETTETNTLLLSSPGDAGVTYARLEDEKFLSRDTGWSWAAVFFDVENDGDDDLYVANGFTDYLTFIQQRPHPTQPDLLYPINNGREPNHFFLNAGGLPVEPVPDSGAELDGLNSRSVALLDYDRDGDLDMAVSTFHADARLLRNDAAAANHWLSIELVGDPGRGASRDAIGARVVAHGAGDLYVWRMVTGGEGYLGMGTPEVEMGLGTATQVDLEIAWPGGARQSVAGVPADRRVRVTQGREGFETLPPG